MLPKAAEAAPVAEFDLRDQQCRRLVPQERTNLVTAPGGYEC